MQLFHLKYVDWLDSQLIYHALPRVGIEGIIILAPNSPYVCIGYHQNLEQEVDLDYCKANNIPIFRREVGGGAVFLDGKQIFYQIILHKDNPLAQGDKSDFYRRLLEPVIKTYGDLGISTKFRPVNDVITLDGRKISGTGAADIGDYRILVGNLIADFDYQTMTHVLRVPDEKFRDKVFKSMTENLTTIKREIGTLPSWDEMAKPLIHNYEKLFGELELSDLPEKVNKHIKVIKPEFLDDNWLYMKRRSKIEANTKIATGVHIIQKLHKAPGGLLKSVYELKDSIISNLSLTGDFFCYPHEAIKDFETFLEGSELSTVSRKVENYYERFPIDTPGVTPEDWLKVML
ncbi:MAG: lipoate--protein ligase family protein [Anaerolineaceae bacterium]|nr:lipoate--protein ligase family protein [Anaerolineaceae bacterium]